MTGPVVTCCDECGGCTRCTAIGDNWLCQDCSCGLTGRAVDGGEGAQAPPHLPVLPPARPVSPHTDWGDADE